MALDHIVNLVANPSNQHIQTLTVFSNHLKNYLDNTTATKTALAEIALSEETVNAYKSFKLSLQNLPTMRQDFIDSWQNLGDQWEAPLWMMYNEPNTQSFYERLNEDMQLYLANLSNPENSEFYSRYFRDLLGMSVEEFSNLSIEQLYVYMNADFPRLEWDEVTEEMQVFFNITRDDKRISMTVRNSASRFIEALEDVQESLHLFLQGNEIALQFHRWVTGTVQSSVGTVTSLNTLRPRQNGRHFPDDMWNAFFFKWKYVNLN